MSNCNPITALHVQAVPNPGPIVNELGDIQYVPIDVNDSAGGDYIYIGYKRESGQPPITYITFKVYDEAQEINPDNSLDWDPTDLNTGAGGKYIYMFYSTDKSLGEHPILDITIADTKSSIPPQIGGHWQLSSPQVDLNEGAEGRYIWFYTTDNLS